MYFDPLYMFMMLPALILAGIATWLTHSTFSRYGRVRSASGLTGAQAAYQMLAAQEVRGVTIERANGFLSDHYDPTSRTLRLSSGVYGSDSLSAIGVACHEAGHALQHAAAWGPLTLRSALVPATQLGSYGSYILITLGMLLRLRMLAVAGVALFTVVVLFALVTLPVEWDASRRAKRYMAETGIVTAAELPHASSVLNAAFLTYVASAFTALLNLLYYLMRLGLLGRRDD